jgi:hypothetical protein
MSKEHIEGKATEKAALAKKISYGDKKNLLF